MPKSGIIYQPAAVRSFIISLCRVLIEIWSPQPAFPYLHTRKRSSYTMCLAMASSTSQVDSNIQRLFSFLGWMSQQEWYIWQASDST